MKVLFVFPALFREQKKTFPCDDFISKTEKFFCFFFQGKRDWNIFMCFILTSHPIFQMFTSKSQSFNNACHKNMYKYNFFFLSSVDVFIFHYVYEWRNVKSETVFYVGWGRNGFFSTLLIEKKMGGYFWSWNFCVFREQYTPRLWDFVSFFESFMFCHFHVSQLPPLTFSRNCSVTIKKKMGFH